MHRNHNFYRKARTDFSGENRHLLSGSGRAVPESLNLASQIGEEEGLRDKMFRLARDNKFAVISAVVILLFIFAAILVPYLTPYDPKHMDLMNRLSPPSSLHYLGTDEGGRDIFTRMLYGARVSLLAGVIPTIISIAIGTVLGMISGFAGGMTDTVIMRFADVMLAFPSTLLAMLIMYTLGGGLANVFLTLSLVGWAGVARVIRAETLKLRKSLYVTAAHSIGVSRPRIIVRHILPNCVPTLIVLFTLNVPSAILTESSLSFLGLGVQPPDTSWGQMINAGRQYLYSAPWLCFVPCAAIMLIICPESDSEPFEGSSGIQGADLYVYQSRPVCDPLYFRQNRRYVSRPDL